MNRDEIIRMAQEADAERVTVFNNDQLERFFHAAYAAGAAAMREAFVDDAERYRWFKDHCGFCLRTNGVNEFTICFSKITPYNLGHLDAAIDASRGKANDTQ